MATTKAATTRQSILQTAFGLIYQNGYQATSIDTIIAGMNVTKGAFFYHFKNKDEMGLAMIDEVVRPGMAEGFIKPLADSQNPVDDIFTMMKHLLLTAPFFEVRYGCPAVNLANELASVNEPLSKALHQVMDQCRESIRDSLVRGKAQGQIRPDIDPERVATFVLAGYSGIRDMGKLYGAASYHTYLRELKRYVTELAP